MTNNYHIVDGPDGEPTLQHKDIRVRRYFFDRVREMVNEQGWEYAASKVCEYCGAYIEDEDENAESVDYICNCDDNDQRPQNPNAPI